MVIYILVHQLGGDPTVLTGVCSARGNFFHAFCFEFLRIYVFFSVLMVLTHMACRRKRISKIDETVSITASEKGSVLKLFSVMSAGIMVGCAIVTVWQTSNWLLLPIGMLLSLLVNIVVIACQNDILSTRSLRNPTYEMLKQNTVGEDIARQPEISWQRILRPKLRY
jgi:hypothetical protein